MQNDDEFIAGAFWIEMHARLLLRFHRDEIDAQGRDADFVGDGDKFKGAGHRESVIEGADDQVGRLIIHDGGAARLLAGLHQLPLHLADALPLQHVVKRRNAHGQRQPNNGHHHHDLNERERPGRVRSADFQVCRAVGCPARWPQFRAADLEVSDMPVMELRSKPCPSQNWSKPVKLGQSWSRLVKAGQTKKHYVRMLAGFWGDGVSLTPNNA